MIHIDRSQIMSRFAQRAKLVVITAALVLASVAATASANRGIEVTPTAITATSVGNITFTDETILQRICPLTLNATLHRTISKAVESLAGTVGAGTFGACGSAGFNLVARLLLLWHLRFQSFTGTLPNITGLLIEATNAAFLFAFETEGIRVSECLYVNNIGVVGTGAAVNQITRLRILSGLPVATLIRTRLQEETLNVCPREVTFAGSFTTTRITLRLI